MKHPALEKKTKVPPPGSLPALPNPNAEPVLPSNTKPPSKYGNLEALLLDLCLGRRDGGGGVRVREATALLAVLQRSSLGGADALTGTVVGTAGRAAVRIADASSRDELTAVSSPDVLSAGVVGCDGRKSGDGDCG